MKEASDSQEFSSRWDRPFVEFWIPPMNDNRAVADSELSTIAADVAQGGCSTVIVNAGADWLSDGVPVEWLADLLETKTRYPQLRFVLFTANPETWQQRMKQVAKLPNPGGAIADRWLDGQAPEGILVVGSHLKRPILDCIPREGRARSIEP